MFVLLVGSDEPPLELAVHEKILHRSDVLAKMCSLHFAEGQAKTIRLPEDSPRLVARLIEFLDGNYVTALAAQPTEGLDLSEPYYHTAVNHLALYVLAEKYQVLGLQNMLKECLLRNYVLCTDGPAFFNLIATAIDSIPSSSTPFWEFFRDIARVHLRSTKFMVDRGGADALEDLMENGGSLATRVFKELRCVTLEKVHESKEAKMEAQGLRGKDTMDLRKAKRMHGSQHPACGQCHVLLD